MPALTRNSLRGGLLPMPARMLGWRIRLRCCKRKPRRAVEFVGMPEARLPLAQAIIAICESPKSNSVCAAVDAAMADAEKGGYGAVPVHLRDTHYAGHDRISSGDGYKYPHDYPGHYVRQNYMPVELQGKKYYFPSDMGHEATIRKNQEIREGCK